MSQLACNSLQVLLVPATQHAVLISICSGVFTLGQSMNINGCVKIKAPLC
jgi:hypothetical protein